MAIPKLYINIKNIIVDYINTLIIMNEFEQKENSLYKIRFYEDNANWIIAILKTFKKNKFNRYTEDFYPYYLITFNKTHYKITIRGKIKSFDEHDYFEFLNHELFKKLRHDNGKYISNIKVDNVNEMASIDKLPITFITIDIIVNQRCIDGILDILTILFDYNDVVYDKLIQKYIKILDKKKRKKKGKKKNV